MTVDSIPRARVTVHTKKGHRELNACLLFAAEALEGDVSQLAGVPAASLRVFPTERAAQDGSFGAPLPAFAARLKDQAQQPQRENLVAAHYVVDEDTLLFHVAPLQGAGKARNRGSAPAVTSSVATERSRASPQQMAALWESINTVWPRDGRGVLLPSRSATTEPGAELAPRWAVPQVRRYYKSIMVNASDDEPLLEEDSIKRYAHPLHPRYASPPTPSRPACCNPS